MADQNLVPSDLVELEAAFRKSPTDLSIQQKILSLLRLHRIRRPDLVMKIGPYLLKKGRGRLGNTVYDVREQILIAALDLHRLGDAQQELKWLQENFPKSLRVKGLEAMIHEARAVPHHTSNTDTAAQNAENSYRKAQELYAEILNEDPCNGFAMKRKVCMLRSKGTQEGTNEAVRALNEYLVLFPTDVEAWREMADLYLELQQVELARFALEEVVMLSPINYASHLKLAEALYTLGDFSTARRYYSQSLELNPDHNARAAYGLVLCATALQPGRGGGGGGGPLNEPLLQCGRKLVLEHYAPGEGRPEPARHTAEAVRAWLGAA